MMTIPALMAWLPWSDFAPPQTSALEPGPEQKAFYEFCKAATTSHPTSTTLHLADLLVLPTHPDLPLTYMWHGIPWSDYLRTTAVSTVPNNATESADYDYYFNSTQAAAELDTDSLSRKFFEANSPTLTGLDTGVKLIDQLLNANAFYLESTFGLGLLSIFTKNNLAIYNVYKLIHDRDQLQYVCGVVWQCPHHLQGRHLTGSFACMCAMAAQVPA